MSERPYNRAPTNLFRSDGCKIRDSGSRDVMMPVTLIVEAQKKEQTLKLGRGVCLAKWMIKKTMSSNHASINQNQSPSTPWREKSKEAAALIRFARLGFS